MIKEWLRSHRKVIWSWLLGSGLVLFAIHNPTQPLIKYLFLPTLGLSITLLVTVLLLSDNWRKLDWGSKWIYIPLIIIAVSIGLSGVINGEGWARLSSAMFGLYLIGIYLMARMLGEEIFKPFTIIVIITTISCIVCAIIHTGSKTGGIISPTNYDIGAGVLIVGAVVSVVRHQWWLWAVAIIGLFFMGADEGLFAMVVLVAVVLIRHDWGKKMLLPIGTLVILLAVCTPLGITQKLYYPAVAKIGLAKEGIEDTTLGHVVDIIIPDVVQKPLDGILDKAAQRGANHYGEEIGELSDSELLNLATGFRWIDHWRISPIKPFGYGYVMTAFYEGIPHNMILIIIEQVGILAAVAWLFLMMYCLIKTKWRYAFIALLALSVFDHYLWTQVAPWIWAIVGVASASSIKSDKIFKLAPVEIKDKAIKNHARMRKLVGEVIK